VTDAPLRTRLEAHLEHCSICAEQLADLQAVAPFYRFAEVPARSPAFWARFVADAQAAAEAADQRRTAPVSRARRWVLRHAWAAACVAVIVAGMAVWRYGGPGTEPPVEQEFAGAIEFYLEQHDAAVAGKVLVETFTVHGESEALQLVDRNGISQ
jgi:hypothetical protein